METIYQISLEKLALHPALARVLLVPDAAVSLLENHHGDERRKEMADDMVADWGAWVDEIQANGIREPLRVIPAGEGYLVIDGRHRHAVAKQLEFETVPCVMAKEGALPAIATGSVTGRRHWTKSQRAFFAILMHPEVAAEDRKKGRPEKSRTECGISNDDLAGRFGVSLRLLEQAIELYRLLESYPDFKPRIEPSLWGGASLAGLLQGLRAITDPSAKSGPGQPVMRHSPAKLSKIWASEQAHASNWAHTDADSRLVLARNLETALSGMPADYVAWRIEIMSRALFQPAPAVLSPGE